MGGKSVRTPGLQKFIKVEVRRKVLKIIIGSHESIEAAKHWSFLTPSIGWFEK